MVVGSMQIATIAQCAKDLDFQPRTQWPQALPAIAWKGQLLTAFEREATAPAIDVNDLQRTDLIESMKACYPAMGLGELARFIFKLERVWPDLFIELREGLNKAYDYRWSDRLSETMQALRRTPFSFQAWVDDKHVSPRDLSPLLALPELKAFLPFLEAMSTLPLTRSEGVRALELGTELFLMGRSLTDILPTQNNAAAYLRQLEKWRRPETTMMDDQWRTDVERWPWPSQVQGQWKRFGDQSGLEVNIRTTSPEDFNKKLERLLSIGNTWSCKT